MPAHNPPSPRRCRRIFDAHHLECQGLSLSQIGDQLGCARSTAHAYLRDFRLYRDHVLRSVVADRLADQVHLLTQPDQEPDRHRQHVAAMRELRLLMLSLPAIQAHDASGDDDASNHDWPMAFFHDGHNRWLDGPQKGECVFGSCRGCRREYELALADKANHKAHDQPDDRPDEPGPDRTEPESDSGNQDSTGPIGTDLDKSEQLDAESPAPSEKSAPPPRKSPPRRPPKPVGPQYPVSWDNPFGYSPPQNELGTLAGRLFGRPTRSRRIDWPPD